MTTKVQEVTGLILHFRTPKATIECIQSLAQEGIRRVVLVDNSEDGGQSLDAMTTPLTKLHGQGMDIRVVNFGCNLGFAKGVNVGLAQAVLDGASAILLINSDATVVTGSISQLTQGLENADVVLPRVRTEPGTETSLFGYYHTMAATLAKRPGARHLKFASGCCMLIRPEVARGNIFDEDFFFYYEDVALANSHIKHGINVKEVSSALIVHAGSGSSKNGSFFYEYHINRGHWLLAGKLAKSTSEKILNIACRCITLPMRASVRCWRFKSFTPWLGLLAATFDVISGKMRPHTPPPKQCNVQPLTKH